MKLYVAGPMTGFPRWNFDEFARVTAKLRAFGHEVVSPAELDLADGFDPDAPVGDFSKADLAKAIVRDVKAVSECEGIALLDGWSLSRGTRAEIAVGEVFGIDALQYTYYLSGANS